MPYPYAPIPKAGAGFAPKGTATQMAAPPITPAAPPAPFSGPKDDLGHTESEYINQFAPQSANGLAAPGTAANWAATVSTLKDQRANGNRLAPSLAYSGIGNHQSTKKNFSGAKDAAGGVQDNLVSTLAKTTGDEMATGAQARADELDPNKQMEKAYQDLINSYDTGLQNRLGNINAQTSADRRRAANMAGMTGHSLGGGLAGAQRQASIGGMRLADDAIAGNETQKREAMMAMLKNKQALAKDEKDKEFEREMSASGQANAIELARLQTAMTPILSPK